jgi:hypothetical protein
LKTVSDTKCILKKTAFLKIKTHEEIPKPRFFKEQNFTPEIMHHINTNIDIVYTNTIEIDGKLINIHFISETPVTPNHTNEYTKLIDILLKFLSQSSNVPIHNLNIYIYLTFLKKSLPTTTIHTTHTTHGNEVLGANHLNTGFTYTFMPEIIIFRNEEWFKVLVHELIHNFGLDFSEKIISKECNEYILSMFNVKSDINLFESYTEFWAIVINAIFTITVSSTPTYINKNNKEWSIDYFGHPQQRQQLSDKIFIAKFQHIMDCEIKFKLFQMVKILYYMDLRYSNILSESNMNINLNLNKYRENTNVFAYCILTTILLFYYSEFLTWCDVHNECRGAIKFKSKKINVKELCMFIATYYNKKKFLNEVFIMEQVYYENKLNFTHSKFKAGSMETFFILNTLRMSIFG